MSTIRVHINLPENRTANQMLKVWLETGKKSMTVNKALGMNVGQPLVSVLLPYIMGLPTSSRPFKVFSIKPIGHFELIVINDGSTDESSSILERFRDERIRCTASRIEGLQLV